MSLLRPISIRTCFVFALPAAFAIACGPPARGDDPRTWRIGVNAPWGRDIATRMWTPTAAYLSGELDGARFQLIPMDLDDLAPAIADQRIDFVLTQPGSYIQLEREHGIARLTTLRTLKAGLSASHFGAVIFTRHDRDDINTLSDLRGRSFRAVKPNAFGGFAMALRELRRAGIERADLAPLSFSGFPQDAVVHAVLAGKADAGTVRTGTIERMVEEGRVAWSQLKLLGERKMADFPFRCSTPLYPEWAFARCAHVPDRFGRRVAVALMMLPPQHAAVQAAQSAGWTAPLDYSAVHACYQELGLLPSETATRGPGVWLLAMSLTVAFAAIALLLRQNRRVRQRNQQLSREFTERLRAEDDLNDALEMRDELEQIIARSPTAILVCRTESGWPVEYVSGNALSLLGFDAAELRARELRYIDLIHPDDRDMMVREFQEAAVAGVKLLTREYRIVTPEGDVRWVDDRASVRRDNCEVATHVESILIDITARKAAEQQALRLAAIVSSSQDAIIGMDLHGRVTNWNRSAVRLFGRTRDRAVGNAITTLLPSTTASQIPDLLDQLRSGAEIAPFEIVLDEQPETRVVRVTVSPIRTVRGQTVGGSLIATDITEQKRSTAALSESNANLRRINVRLDRASRQIKELMDAVVAEPMTTARFQNDELQPCWEVRGCTNSECRLHGKALSLRCWEIDSTECARGKSRAAHRENCQQCTVYQDARRDPLNELGETFNDMVAILQERQRQLEQTASIAHAATQAKSDFLANMSHEIRTPMTAILGFAENLLDEALEDDERDRAVDTIRRNGNYLLAIINDILDLSKIEAGKLLVEDEPIDLIQLLADVDVLARVRADEKNIPLRIEFDGKIPRTIHSDPTRLRQILINLIGNAIKFTEEGNVQVRVAVPQHGPIGMLTVDVIDTGIGMTDEHVARLFEPFGQADATVTRRYGGTGLGLIISKRLSEMLGGSIELVRTAPAAGTHFRAQVAVGDLTNTPLHDNPADALADAGRTQHREVERAIPDLNCRILVAEDGPDNQRLIAHVLRKAQAEVTLVENGALAVEAALTALADAKPFDMILMDMQMPVMDGYTATTMLRSEGYRHPIVALTAHAMSNDRERCLAAGCDDYATKPINRKRLIRLIAAFTSARHLERMR